MKPGYHQTLMLIFLCLLASSCSPTKQSAAPTESASTGRTPQTPTRLVLNQRLLDGNLKLLTAFADFNRDGKPDMILGSNGHEFSDSVPGVVASTANKDARHYASHLLNTSNGGKIEFGKPWRPNPHGEDGQLPSG